MQTQRWGHLFPNTWWFLTTMFCLFEPTTIFIQLQNSACKMVRIGINFETNMKITLRMTHMYWCNETRFLRYHAGHLIINKAPFMKEVPFFKRTEKSWKCFCTRFLSNFQQGHTRASKWGTKCSSTSSGYKGRHNQILKFVESWCLYRKQKYSNFGSV